MTSRSCSATLRSVFAACLLCLGCTSGKQDSSDRRDASQLKPHDEGGSLEDEGGGDVDGGEAPPIEDDSAAEGSGGDPQALDHSPPARPCPAGQMQFEDRCQPKEQVSRIVEARETKALADVNKAKGPGEKIEATRDLIEQQVVQAERAEDDLDEIIEQLERKNAETDLKELAGDGGKIERRPP